MTRTRLWSLGICATYLAAASACTPATPLPVTVAPGDATAGATSVPAAGFDNLVADLRDSGSTVEVGSRIEQPYVPIAGTAMTVDGAEVQVFEFSDTASRTAVTDAFAQADGTDMAVLPEGVNLWAQGRLVVLYLGQNEQTRDTLTTTLGTPLKLGEGGSDLPPAAVLEAQRWLAQELNTVAARVTILDVSQEDWSDSCLGLGGPAESCAAVITPGWRVIFEVDGQRYEVRTDETGRVIRMATGETTVSELEGTEWRLTGFDAAGAETAPVAASTITLAFESESKLSGSGGCNSYGGDYQADTATLSISSINSTLRACNDAGVTEQEQRYLTALETVQSYQLSQTELVLTYDGGALRFAPMSQ